MYKLICCIKMDTNQSTNNMKLITVLGTNYTIAKVGIGIIDMLKLYLLLQ